MRLNISRTSAIKGRQAILFLAAAAVPLGAGKAYAATKTYTGSLSGNWSTLAWTPAGQPVNGDDVWLRPASGNVIVTYDAAAVSTSLASLTIDVTNAAAITFAQAQGNLLITGTEFVGYTGTGSFNLSGGTHTVNNGMFFGYNSGASGNGSLSGNGVLNVAGVGDEEYIGYFGNGSFTQSGGSNTTYYLTTGFQASGSGVYTQTGGTLNVTSGEYVGYIGNGIVNQSGGTNNSANLYLGYNPNSTSPAATGVYSMSNGANLAVSGSFYVGVSGSGTFNQTGGIATASNGMTLGASAGGTGTVNFSGGTLNSSTVNINNASSFNQTGGTLNSATININNAGKFNQSGGTVIGSPNLFIGNVPTTASYSLSGNGGLTAGSEYVGYNGAGAFNQSGGNNSAANLYLAFNGSSSTGVYSMSNGAGLTVTGNLWIGGQGNGIFNQSGGSVNGFGGISLGASAGANGTVNLSGGTLTAPILAVENASVFNQTGGTLNLIGAGFNLTIGSTTTTASFNLSGNGLIQSVNQTIGPIGRGAFTQIGGTNSLLGALFLGSDAAGVGTYSLTGGSIGAASAYVGGSQSAAGGTGTLNIGGSGAMVLSGPMVLWNSGSSGVNLTGGSLSVGSLDTSGAPSHFNWTAGSLSITASDLYVDTIATSPLGSSLALGNGQALSVPSNNEFVGFSGGAGVVNQSGGSHTAFNLFLGYSYNGTVAGSGTYNLGNGASLAVTNTEYVGYFANGVFNQTGGSNTVTGTLHLGYASAGNGTANGNYTLSNGSLSVAGGEYIGDGGNGTFTQNGGNHNASVLYLGQTSGGTGTFNLSSGLLTVSTFEAIGVNGIGRFLQTGGTHAVNGTGANRLEIGNNWGSTGTYGLSNAASLVVAGDERIGDFGNGTFNQSGGSHTVGGQLSLGWTNASGTNPAGIGTYNLSGGVLTVANNIEAVGYFGSGTFNQTGGTNAGSNSFYVGLGSSGTNLSSGVYTMSAGSLSTVFTEYIGNNGIGVFNQSGGINTATFLNLGQQTNSGSTPSGFGTYNLSNGATLNLSGGSIGVYGNGVFNQTGGLANITGTNGGSPEINVGLGPIANGTVNLSGGSMIEGTNFTDNIGFDGHGVFNQSGGTHTTAIMNLGFHSSGSGVYNLGNGASLSVANWEFVGDSGIGTFNQTGGSHTVYQLRMGENPVTATSPSFGTYNLSGGTLSVGYDEFVGEYGNGAFFQSGGTHTAQYLNVGGKISGSSPPSTGIYTMTGGTLTVSSEEYSGLYGIGTINHSGGTNTTNNLYLGYYANGTNAPSQGAYNLSSGAVLNVSNDLHVGLSGIGVFNQTGGSNSIGDWLYVGHNVSSSGIYNLSGGSLSALTESIGYQGLGTFNQSGGNNTITSWGTISIGGGGGIALGTYNFSGGNVNGNIVNDGNFNMTGGTFNGTLTNNLNFTYGGGNFNGRFIQGPTGVFNLTPYAFGLQTTGGILVQGTLPIGANQYVDDFTQGIDIEGGVVVLSGGSIGGWPLLNNGTISGFGAITGSTLTNNGVISQSGGNLTLGAQSSALNNGTINLANGRQFTLSSTNLVSAGSINLNGAQVSGTNALVNTFSGIISGPGMIVTPLQNAGSILLPAGTLNIVQPFTNTGAIQITGPGASLIGGGITNAGMIQLGAAGANLSASSVNNTGTIQGIGTVASPTTNNGVIEPIGGILAFTGPLTNPTPGLLRIANGNKLLITGGLATNFGTIDLTGGTFDNNNKPLANNGVISGFGLLSTGGLTNTPGNVITFSGGLSTVNGPVTNSAGATIRANYNPILFTGPVVNNGIIKINGAPTNNVTFASSYSGGGQYLSDPADNYFQNVTVTAGGLIAGSIGDRFFINGGYSNSGTYLNSGGTLAAQDIINSGQLNQTAGQATIANLSGPGSTTVGGAGTSLVSVASFAQGSINIQNGGTLFARSAATPHAVTDSVGTLAISTTGSAILDLNNHDLLIDNSRTSFANVQSYWRSGYNMHPYNAGFDDEGAGYYDGTHGLISSVAKADQSFKHQVGYIDGNAQNIYGFTMSDIGGPDLATNRILVRPVLMGDVNFDGKVDPSDIQVLLGTNKFGKGPGTATDGWIDGDFNGDGVADPTDIQLLLAANTFNSGQTYGAAKSAKASSATGAKTLTGGSLVVTATTTIGGFHDNKFDYEYDPISGDVTIHYDGDPNITAANTLQHMKLASAAGKFIVANVNNSGVSIPFSIENPSLLDMVQNDNTKPIPDRYDLGQVLPKGLTLSDLMSDLTLQFGVLNQFALKQADAYISPEPTTLGLIGVAAVGLLSRRRKNQVNTSVKV